MSLCCQHGESIVNAVTPMATPQHIGCLTCRHSGTTGEMAGPRYMMSRMMAFITYSFSPLSAWRKAANMASSSCVAWGDTTSTGSLRQEPSDAGREEVGCGRRERAGVSSRCEALHHTHLQD